MSSTKQRSVVSSLQAGQRNSSQTSHPQGGAHRLVLQLSCSSSQKSKKCCWTACSSLVHWAVNYLDSHLQLLATPWTRFGASGTSYSLTKIYTLELRINLDFPTTVEISTDCVVPGFKEQYTVEQSHIRLGQKPSCHFMPTWKVFKRLNLVARSWQTALIPNPSVSQSPTRSSIHRMNALLPLLLVIASLSWVLGRGSHRNRAKWLGLAPQESKGKHMKSMCM